MRHALLIVNPAAGRARRTPALLGPAQRAEMLRICREWGWTAEFAETGPEPGSAERLSAAAMREGVRLVIACGGDGTVREVLQGVAGTDTVLGVLPFGTANALARNLKLPLEPVAALRRLMGYRVQRIPVGLAETGAGSRWFAVLAGAGPDGMLVQMAADQAESKRQASVKARFGRNAYYGRAARLFLTRRFPAFQVEYRSYGQADWVQQDAIGVLASRVPNLGGLFRGLTAASRLHHPYLQVQVLRAPGQISLAAWFALAHLRLGRWNPLVRRVRVEELRCSPLGSGRVPHAQVDGEAAGTLPIRMRMVPDALSLLVPAWSVDDTPSFRRLALRLPRDLWTRTGAERGTGETSRAYGLLCADGARERAAGAEVKR